LNYIPTPPHATVARTGTGTTLPAYRNALQHDCRLYLLHVMKCIIVHCAVRQEGCTWTVKLTIKCAWTAVLLWMARDFTQKNQPIM